MPERERRAEPRITPEKPLKTKVRAFVPAKVVDISHSGIQIELPQPLPPKTACDLRFQTEEGEITLKATVRSCRVLGSGIDEKNERVLFYRAGLMFDEQGRRRVSEIAGLWGPGLWDRAGMATGKSTQDGQSPAGKEGSIEISFEKDSHKGSLD